MSSPSKTSSNLTSSSVLRKNGNNLKKKYPFSKIKPELAWHGTSDVAVDGIKSKGLVLPGQGNNVGHASGNKGFYGDGIYLSPMYTYSRGYMRGGRKGLFLCSVLLGRSRRLTDSVLGQPVTLGYDSHIDPSGNEYVLFDEGQVLPCYLIELK